MRFLQNFRTCGFRRCVVLIHIVDKHGQGLRSIPELCRRSLPAACLCYLDRRFARPHLPAARTVAVAVKLSKPESRRQPSHRLHQVLIRYMGQHRVGGYGTIFCRHNRDSTLRGTGLTPPKTWLPVNAYEATPVSANGQELGTKDRLGRSSEEWHCSLRGTLR